VSKGALKVDEKKPCTCAQSIEEKQRGSRARMRFFQRRLQTLRRHAAASKALADEKFLIHGRDTFS
jgi:hypothetical protein